jgi:hypothetical protein
MNEGFRKSALIAYLALCIYMLAQPSPGNLNDRAEALDKQLAGKGRAALTPALAAALQMPAAKVEIYLSLPGSQPSDLVFAKLLDKCGAHAENETPADTVLHAGMPAREALAYFDTVEKTVEATLAKEQKFETIARSTALRASTPFAALHTN